VGRATWCSLREATRVDRRDTDLAGVVASAMRGSLKERLLAYRERALAARQDPTRTH
jgi:hypothetical protein